MRKSMTKLKVKPKMEIKVKSSPTSRSPELKFKVAMEALCNSKSLQEVAREYGVVSSQVFNWKKVIIDHGKDLFTPSDSVDSNSMPQVNKLYAQLGRLKAENDRLAQIIGKNNYR